MLKPTATHNKAHLKLVLTGTGSVDLDVVSLFPKDTWMGRPNGLRTDLVQLLKDMKPGFLRFPGGCIVEGRTLSERYQWKETIGDVASRHAADKPLEHGVQAPLDARLLPVVWAGLLSSISSFRKTLGPSPYPS